MGPKPGREKPELPSPIKEALKKCWGPGALPAVQDKQDTVCQGKPEILRMHMSINEPAGKKIVLAVQRIWLEIIEKMGSY